MTVVSNTSEALNSPYTNALEHMLAETRAHALDSSVTEIDRLAIAHDASHYLLVPAGIVRPILRRRSLIFSVPPAPSTCRSPSVRAAPLYQGRQAATG